MGKRYQVVDATRGAAVALMIIFHFCFLLKEFGYAFSDFSTNPFWHYFRLLIVTTFLLLVGVSLKLSTIDGLQVERYFIRLFKIGFYAAIVSVATYFYDSDRTVYFGILQFIFTASLMGVLFLSLKWLNLLFGLILIILGYLNFQLDLNSNWFYWSGLLMKTPYTLDYVPLVPWFGVVLVGITVGNMFEFYSKNRQIGYYKTNNRAVRTLLILGKNSLNIYMAHMPILFTAILIYQRVLQFL